MLAGLRIGTHKKWGLTPGICVISKMFGEIQRTIQPPIQ
jgi:hypothetical protein